MPEKSGIDAAPCAPTLARLARSWAPPVAQRRGQPPPMSLIEGTPAAPSSCPPPDHGCVDFQSPRRPRHVPLAALRNATPFSGMPERGRRQLVATRPDARKFNRVTSHWCPTTHPHDPASTGCCWETKAGPALRALAPNAKPGEPLAAAARPASAVPLGPALA